MTNFTQYWQLWVAILEGLLGLAEEISECVVDDGIFGSEPINSFRRPNQDIRVGSELYTQHTS